MCWKIWPENVGKWRVCARHCDSLFVLRVFCNMSWSGGYFLATFSRLLFCMLAIAFSFTPTVLCKLQTKPTSRNKLSWLRRMQVIQHCLHDNSSGWRFCNTPSPVESRHNCRAQSFSISDRLHCSFYFVFCFFFRKTGPFLAKNLLECAQAGPRGLYTKPEYDKLVATA